MDNDKQMNLIRQLYVGIFRVWHPSFFMAVLHFALYFVSHVFPQQPVIEFVTEKLPLLGFMNPVFWQVAFFSTGIVMLKWDHPRHVLVLSSPSLLYGWFVTWYGLSTHSLPPDAVIFILAAYLAIIGVAILWAVIADLQNKSLQQQATIAKLEARIKATASTEVSAA